MYVFRSVHFLFQNIPIIQKGSGFVKMLFVRQEKADNLKLCAIDRNPGSRNQLPGEIHLISHIFTLYAQEQTCFVFVLLQESC